MFMHTNCYPLKLIGSVVSLGLEGDFANPKSCDGRRWTDAIGATGLELKIY